MSRRTKTATRTAKAARDPENTAPRKPRHAAPEADPAAVAAAHVEEARRQNDVYGPSGMQATVPTAYAMADQLSRQVGTAARLPAYPYAALEPTGRRRKALPNHGLTPPTWYRVLDFIRRGNSPDVAAAIAGVPSDVFETWCYSSAFDEVPLIRQFRAAMRHAMAINEAVLVETVHQAATDKDDPSVQAAQYLLERRHGARWAPKPTRMELSGVDGAPIQSQVDARVAVVALSPAERFARIEALRERARARLASSSAARLEAAEDAEPASDDDDPDDLASGRYATDEEPGDDLVTLGHARPRDRNVFREDEDADPTWVRSLTAEVEVAETVEPALPEDDRRNDPAVKAKAKQAAATEPRAFGMVDGVS